VLRDPVGKIPADRDTAAACGLAAAPHRRLRTAAPPPAPRLRQHRRRSPALIGLDVAHKPSPRSQLVPRARRPVAAAAPAAAPWRLLRPPTRPPIQLTGALTVHNDFLLHFPIAIHIVNHKSLDASWDSLSTQRTQHSPILHTVQYSTVQCSMGRSPAILYSIVYTQTVSGGVTMTLLTTVFVFGTFCFSSD